MRKLSTTLCLTLAVLLGSAGVSFALPECEGSPSSQTRNDMVSQGFENWDECIGVFTWKTGDKYIGEWEDGEFHGEGKFISSSGEVEEGIWENHEFQYAQKISPTITALNASDSTRKLGNKIVPLSPGCPDSPTDDSDIAREWDSCVGTLTFAKSGNKYVGEFRNGNFNGQGAFTFAKSGTKFVGEYKDGKRNGHFTVTYGSGNKFVGEYRDAKKHGHGTLTFAKSGNKYVGEFRNGKFNGQGAFTFANSNKYVGEFKDGKRNGHFTVTYGSGDKYLGGFRNNKKHGHSIYTYANGQVKEGIWENGKFLRAKKISPRKIVRKTPSSPSLKKPVQSFALPDGRSICHGSPSSSLTIIKRWNYCFGIFILSTGHRYAGYWEDGKQHGQGTFTFKDGNKYVGEWRNDYYHGQGTYTFGDGQVKKGIWRNGKLLHTKVLADGEVKKGISENGKLLHTKKISPRKIVRKPSLFVVYNPGWGQSPSCALPRCRGDLGQKHWSDCIGTKVFTSGEKYTGEWEKGERHGSGVNTYPNGNKFVGQWKNDNKQGPGVYTNKLSETNWIIKKGYWWNNKLKKQARGIRLHTIAIKLPSGMSENDDLQREIADNKNKNYKKNKPSNSFAYDGVVDTWRTPSIVRIRSLAHKGNPIAQMHLAFFHDKGGDVCNGKSIRVEKLPKDCSKAFGWMKRSAGQGYAPAQYRMGRYLLTKGYISAFCRSDHYYNEKAGVKWYKLAAQQGHVGAQYSLGRWFDHPKKNYKAAAKWYKLAAQQGHVHSQYSLGQMFARVGEFEKKNYIYSHMWLNIAASHGSWKGVVEREKVASLMTPSQIEKAQDLAQRKCVRKKGKGCRLCTKPSDRKCLRIIKKFDLFDPLQQGIAALSKNNYTTALRIFRGLAEQGNYRAQAYLGMIWVAAPRPRNIRLKIGNVKGWAARKVQGYMWLTIADSHQVKEKICWDRRCWTPAEWMEILRTKRRVSPRAVEIAQNLARECEIKSYKGCGGILIQTN